MLRVGLLSILAVVLATLWVSQCSGPKPSVVGSARVEAPQQPGDPYRVEASIRNDGPGHGEARVTFRLIDAGAGAAYQKDEPVELERGETARVVVEIPAPPGDYAADVDVQYPPE
jgi:hypothetical protein